MAPKVKEALSWMSEAIETALGWGLCLVAIYTILFVNFTGNGTLWDSLRGVALDSTAAKTRSVAVEMRVVPVRPPDLETKAQNHMLMIPEVPDQEIRVPIVAANQPRGADQLTDALASDDAGKTWKKHLNGNLRTFTVYGQGEESSSASASVPTQGAPALVASAATPAVAASAYHAGTAAKARPGISDHVTPVANTSDGVRNFR
jgi:hypothetical protein